MEFVCFLKFCFEKLKFQATESNNMEMKIDENIMKLTQLSQWNAHPLPVNTTVKLNLLSFQLLP